MENEKPSADNARGAAASPPPSAIVLQLSTSHFISRALYLAAKLKIADLLKDGPRPFGEIAKATGTNGPALNRVLRLLASAGVFTEGDNGNFSLTPVGQCLRTGMLDSSHALVMLFGSERLEENWKNLEYCVRTGEPAFRLRGVTDPFSDLLRTPELEATFDAAMADVTRRVAIAVSAEYDFGTIRTLVDVGGGNGTLLTGILKANPFLHGIVYDSPATAERAKKLIEESGLADRCDAVGGDFFKEVPAGGDAYILKHVIHDWNDDRATAILRNCHRAMDPKGRLLIVEGVCPVRIDESPQSRGTASNDVNMLVSTGGRVRSEAEFRSLYDAAGFKLTRIVPTQSGFGVIEGTRI
jgi:SAM-dependent methyltransferase